MGFRSPLFILGVGAAPVAAQGGFRTPIPGWNAGAPSEVVTQGGFLTPLPFWRAGGGSDIPDILRGGDSDGYRRRLDKEKKQRDDLDTLLHREDEEIISVILAINRKR